MAFSNVVAMVILLARVRDAAQVTTRFRGDFDCFGGVELNVRARDQTQIHRVDQVGRSS